MTEFKGYTGKILDIDLTSGNIGSYAISDELRAEFLGGRLLSTRILWDELYPGTDPLAPDNVLVIMTGPLNGSGAPAGGKFDISAKSPLTGGIGHSNSGGRFGLQLKKAGWDGLIVRGRSLKPVYIEIDNDKVAIKDAGLIWGRDTREAQAMLGGSGSLVIGPAGERQVRYASVAAGDRMHGRAGMGAVMGSKKLKGLAASGQQRLEVYDREALQPHNRRWSRQLRAHMKTGTQLPRYGTSGAMEMVSNHHALATQNFSRGSYTDAGRLSGQRMAAEILVKNAGCLGCPIQCGRVVKRDGRRRWNKLILIYG